MRIAGVDPGTIRTGVAILEESGKDFSFIEARTIHAKEEEPIAERLKIIYDHLVQVFQELAPDVVALENVFYQKDFKAAVKVGEARAAAMLAASTCHIPVVEYPPARIKQSICGNGRATKEQVQYMVRHLLRLREPLGPDAADAVAVAFCHLHSNQFTKLKNEALAHV